MAKLHISDLDLWISLMSLEEGYNLTMIKEMICMLEISDWLD
jgi:hypothetical protein